MGKSFSKKDDEPLFLMRGLYGSGRSSLLYRVRHGEMCQDEMKLLTHEDFGGYFEHSGGKLIGWDFNGGRQPDRKYAQLLYYDRMQGFVYVIDSADHETIDESITILKEDFFQYEKAQESVLMVIANKQDLENALSPQEIEDKIKKECKLNFGLTTFVMPCSVVTGEGVQTAFDYFWTLMKMKEKKQLKPGLLPEAWKKAEQQLADNNFDDIIKGKKRDLSNEKDSKKNPVFKWIKCVLSH